MTQLTWRQLSHRDYFIPKPAKRIRVIVLYLIDVGICFLFCLIPFPSVFFLQSPYYLIFFAVDDIQVVVTELSPLFLELSFHLFLVSFYLIPIHRFLPSLLGLSLALHCSVLNG